MFSRFVAELRSSPRLRLGLAAILGILWLYAILLLRDAVDAKMVQHQTLVRQIARAKTEAAQTQWRERAEAAKMAQVELESRLWQNGTLGLAQAAFQDWLNQQLVRAAIGRPAVTLAAMDEEGGKQAEGIPDDLWKVKAKLEFDFAPQSFNSLMAQLGGNDKRVVVETLNIRTEPIPRVEAVVAAYFQKARTP